MSNQLPTFSQATWDASFDGVTIETKLSFADINLRMRGEVPGAKVVTDAFTSFDLKKGAHKVLTYSNGRESATVRVQLHPIRAELLSETPDSFGTVA